MDDPGVGRIGADRTGDPIVEAHAQGDEQVGRLDGLVDVLPAVHAHVAVGQRVVLGDVADAKECPGDRDLGLVGERPELLGGVGDEHTVAREDDRALGFGDGLGRQLDLARMALEARLEAGQVERGRVGGPRLGRERVLGEVDVHRTRAAGTSDVEGLRDDARDLVGTAHQVVVLRHRQRDAADVDLLEGVLAQERTRHVAGERDHRHRVELGCGDAGDQVGGTGAGRPEADTDASAGSSVAVGSMCGSLLVADEDGA